MNHTQTPWNAYQQQDAKTGHYDPRWAIHGPGMTGIVANIHFDLTQATTTKQYTNAQANAAYIIQAVNSYEAMKEALELIEDAYAGEVCSQGQLLAIQQLCRKVLAKAKGVQP